MNLRDQVIRSAMLTGGVVVAMEMVLAVIMVILGYGAIKRETEDNIRSEVC